MKEMRSDKKRNKNRSRLIAGALSFLFSAAILFGARLDDVENVDVKDITLWLQLAAFTVIFTGVVLLLWQFLDVLGKRERKDGRKVPNIIAGVIERAGGYEEVLSFLFLILCWLPVFLAVYPGFFVYDAQDEYIQVATRTFSTHHPLVHVLLLGGVVCGIHKLTDSYNMGIACYTVFQMAAAAGVFYLSFFLSSQKKGVACDTADRDCLAGAVSHGGDVYALFRKGRAVYAGTAAFARLSAGDGNGGALF